MSQPLHVQLIVGSTRQGRAADRVIPWVLDRVTAHEDFEPELLDLRDWPLPMFAEGVHSLGDLSDPTYSEPIVRAWNKKIRAGDAFIFITPEYNHSVPGVLKNAVDNVFFSFALRNKPAAFVGYSGGNVGGARAVEHLAHIAIEAEMVPLRNTVLIGGVGSAFEGAAPTNPVTDFALSIMLDDLAWWGRLLADARVAGELAPGGARMRALQAAAAKA